MVKRTGQKQHKWASQADVCIVEIRVYARRDEFQCSEMKSAQYARPSQPRIVARDLRRRCL